jgi:hypothetical protein
MKQTTFKLFALLLALALLLPFSLACTVEDAKEMTEAEKFAELSESEKAQYILSMDVESDKRVAADIVMELSTTYLGSKTTGKVIGTRVQIDTEENFVDYFELKTSTTRLNNTTTTIEREGFIDGRLIYYKSSSGGYYAYMTKEQYLEAYNDVIGDAGDISGFTQDSYRTASCVESGDNWVATYTDLTEDSLDMFKAIAETFGDMVDPDTITDATLTLTITKDLKPVSVNITFEFSNSGTTLTMTSTYRMGDDVTVPSVNLYGYKEINY